MEENENVDGVQTDNMAVEPTEEVACPSREQILEGSRKENKRGDEREQQTYNKALVLGYAVGMIFLAIVMLVTVFVEDRVPTELYMCYSSVYATSGLYYGIKASKRRGFFLACGILGVITCIIFIVFWILQLCGVA